MKFSEFTRYHFLLDKQRTNWIPAAFFFVNPNPSALSFHTWSTKHPAMSDQGGFVSAVALTEAEFSCFYSRFLFFSFNVSVFLRRSVSCRPSGNLVALCCQHFHQVQPGRPTSFLTEFESAAAAARNPHLQFRATVASSSSSSSVVAIIAGGKL